jgi:DUF1009 family protein
VVVKMMRKIQDERYDLPSRQKDIDNMGRLRADVLAVEAGAL